MFARRRISTHRFDAGSRPSAGPSERRHVFEPQRLHGGNRAQLLRRGAQAYPAMLWAITGARSHVHLESYILRSDETGKRFQAALIERARAGVKVRLMFDSVGSFGLISDDFLAELAKAGVEIVEYHPILPVRKRLILRLRELRARADERRGRAPRAFVRREPGHWSFHNRDHQKILVVDDRLAFTGGLNIGDEYAAGPLGADWHDLHLRVEGPAAIGLAQSFRRAWLRGGGEPFAEPPPPEHRTDPMLMYVCDNFGLRERWRMHRAYRHAIRAARHSISISNAYFIPDWFLRRALQEAAKRGVSVRVMVPARSDVRLVHDASRFLFGALLRSGVRIFEYQGRMMHAKAAVIDGHWATIGSYNLDHRSMFHNLEAGVVALDADFAGSLERQFEDDLRECHEVTPAEWSRRTWSAQLRSWFAYQFHYWL